MDGRARETRQRGGGRGGWEGGRAAADGEAWRSGAAATTAAAADTSVGGPSRERPPQRRDGRRRRRAATATRLGRWEAWVAAARWRGARPGAARAADRWAICLITPPLPSLPVCPQTAHRLCRPRRVAAAASLHDRPASGGCGIGGARTAWEGARDRRRPHRVNFPLFERCCVS